MKSSNEELSPAGLIMKRVKDLLKEVERARKNIYVSNYAKACTIKRLEGMISLNLAILRGIDDELYRSMEQVSREAYERSRPVIQ